MFNSASVIKIPVLVLAFQMAEKGAINLDERITIRKEDIRGGSGIFRYHDARLAADVPRRAAADGDHQRQHRDRSGDRQGRRRRARQCVAEGIRLRRSGSAADVQTTGDLFAKYNALGPTDDRNAKTNADRTYWLGEITPRGVGLMIEAIEKKTIASAASCDAMLRMMRGQQAGARRLNHFITVPVAHKTGDFPPVLANDVGIIYARSGPIVVSFLGNAITGNYGEAEDRIGRFAAATRGATSINETSVLLLFVLCYSVSFWRLRLPAQEPPLWPGAKYDPAIPTLKSVLGHDHGEVITTPDGHGAVSPGAAESRADQDAIDRIREDVGGPSAVAVRDRQPRSHREARSGQGRSPALRRSAPHARRPTAIAWLASCRSSCG